MVHVTYAQLSEAAIIIDFGEEINQDINAKILQLASNLADDPFHGFIESVPAYTTLTVYYNPFQVKKYPYRYICSLIDSYLENLIIRTRKYQTIKIPVCYEEEFGPDLQEVATINSLSSNEVIAIHTAPTYPVYFLGFSPGFPFLGGLNPKIATPRKPTPRLTLPAGSVGIAGKQTGVYPSASPGGWQIIGRTPTSLLQLNKKQPTLLQPGDQVKFYAISKQEFYKREDTGWDYE